MKKTILIGIYFAFFLTACASLNQVINKTNDTIGPANYSTTHALSKDEVSDLDFLLLKYE